MKPLTRIYHPHYVWEEIENNMWGGVNNKVEAIQKTLNFMKDTKAFSESMYEVVKTWKYSCEHNLTNTSQNRIAWLGQAAVANKLKIPEQITREAWGLLSEEKQNRANNEAKEAIKYWEKKYA